MENEALSLQDRYVSSWKYGIFQEMFISKLVTMEICSKGAPEIKYSILTGRIRWREPGGRSQAPMNHGIRSDFFQWFGIFIVFFLEMILHWFFFDSGGCFRMIFSPMICSSRCVFQVAPHHPPLVQSWESFKKTTQSSANCQQLLVHCGWKKSHSWKDHENCC